MGGKTSTAIKNRYNAKAYDQIPFRVKKGIPMPRHAADFSHIFFPPFPHGLPALAPVIGNIAYNVLSLL